MMPEVKEKTEDKQKKDEIKEETNREETKTNPDTEKKEEPKGEEEMAGLSEKNKPNWRAFREQREQERKAREEAERIAKQKQEEAEALKKAMEAILNRPSHAQQQEAQDYEDDEDDDKRVQRMIQQALDADRKKQEQERQQREVAEMPAKLQQSFQDFGQVCSTENIDYLEWKYPEVAKAFQHMPDGYDKWASVYHAIKKLVPSDRKDAERRIEQNQQKPQSHIASVTDKTPQTQGWRLTEQQRRENWRRMQQYQKSV